MARINVETRPSAAQMLVKCFGGSGLTTARNLAPPLACINSETLPTLCVPPSPRAKTPPPKFDSWANYRRTPRSRLSGGDRVGKFKRMNRYQWPGMLGRLGVAVVDEREDIPVQGVCFGFLRGINPKRPRVGDGDFIKVKSGLKVLLRWRRLTDVLGLLIAETSSKTRRVSTGFIVGVSLMGD